MGVRDNELNRLVRYAQGMGLSVSFKPYISGSSFTAEWAIDGTKITIYVGNKCSKTEKILSLIHEISHQKGFIDNGRKFDPKVEEALDPHEDKKKYRKRILDMETEHAVYWEDIYRDTNCTFPIYKLHRQKEFDLWVYEFNYENGRNPTTKERNARWKELRKKYE